MDDVNEVRARNYRMLMQEFKATEAARGLPERGSLNRFGNFAGISPRHLSHVNNARKAIGAETARKIEAAFGRPHGWMDHDHLGGPVIGNKAEREYLQLGPQMFRESPVEAQAALLHYFTQRMVRAAGDGGGEQLRSRVDGQSRGGGGQRIAAGRKSPARGQRRPRQR